VSLGRTLTLVALAAFMAAPALAAPSMVNNMQNAMSNSNRNVNLDAQNRSGQSGQAWIKNVPGGIWVKVQVKNEPRGASEPVHIHKGTCSALNPAPWKPLNNVVNGVSVTTVRGVSVADIKRGKYAINVHKSASDLMHYVSCGSL
jgi:hypothetical protein